MDGSFIRGMIRDIRTTRRVYRRTTWALYSEVFQFNKHGIHNLSTFDPYLALSSSISLLKKVRLSLTVPVFSLSSISSYRSDTSQYGKLRQARDFGMTFPAYTSKHKSPFHCSY